MERPQYQFDLDLQERILAKSHASSTRTFCFEKISNFDPRLYNTGDGTILSGSTHGRLDTIAYGGGTGGLTPETLIYSVPEVLDIAQFAVRNISGTGSANADSDRFLNISMHAQEQLCSSDSDVVGAVMIHGTNTLAETVSLPSIKSPSRLPH